MTDAVSEARRVVLEWHVRPSLLTYMRGTPDFAATVEGGAEFTGEVVRLPAVRAGDGRLEATGAVELSGHGGALTLPLRGVVIEGDALWIDDPVGSGGRHRLVNLRPRAEGGAEGGAENGYDTTLAAESDILFLYSYLPDTSFGPLFVLDA